MNSRKLEPIKYKLGFSNVFGVARKGRSGGLALFWHEKTGLEIQNFSRRHINAKISPVEGASWKLTGFYGHVDASKREEPWSILRHIATLSL